MSDMVEAFDLVIFGGTGDLSRRKLLPALFSGFAAGVVPEGSRILLTSRSGLEGPVDAWLKQIFAETEPACGQDEKALSDFAAMVQVIELGLVEGGKDWDNLTAILNAEPEHPIVHFLAIPPALFTSTCDLLGQYGLNGERARVVLEKPLGHSLKSARAINEDVGRTFGEEQTFRIDHYLGKEAVQNLLALRFSNILFEELWSGRTIDHIQITIAENQGVKGRAGFYEGTGALRDMVQNHLLQLLCLVAMEPPARLEADSIREEKLKVLKSLKPLDGQEIERNVVRAQYVAGAMQGEAVGGYAEDLNLEEPSNTETFVAIKAHIENWRWAGVPFYLRTGKRLPDRFAEIVIQFKNVPHSPHPAWGTNLSPNRFIIRLQPEDHLALRMMVKNHSAKGEALREVEMNLDVVDAGADAVRIGPYLRLILDTVAGDQSLFVHRDEVEHAWRWVDRIIDHWQDSGEPPLPYPAGTWGPYEAHDLMTHDKRQWFHEMGKRVQK
ncbi:glucose-6-phosphate dehydrogenase [Kordiimonas marina]|uniref:glucose-6-phosphate dehydrogenase n=1 Tax=Kordiimonas marina TaxID=2872312 RepID=UPI001FF383AC|nr:glucose-6-phosphate dehydrogenase [Kordiimonas marina]MCJ9430684.1 glucose-6-phosphate dehydrogenase [Kordiimonas marina]